MPEHGPGPDGSPAGDVARAAAGRFNDRLAPRALAMEGTCTGEHAMGHGRLGFMALERGNGLSVMRAVKRALDPHGLLNPGEVPPPQAPGRARGRRCPDSGSFSY